VINAEGEYQAAQRLAEASAIIGKHPIALQLRFLQTLTEMASENNSTTVFPLPVDLLAPFLKAADSQAREQAPTASPEAPKPT
jgi:regulator of protease activity HflC (stomatin/prohibitin superfamily)